MKIFFLIRSLWGCFLFVFLTLICSFLMLLFSYKGTGRRLQNLIIQFWGKVSLILFGVKVEILGIEKLREGSGLLLFNHSSFFDIFVICAAFSDFRFGAKIELFKIPFFGAAMRRAGVLPIARQNREEVFKIYEEATSRAHAGEKFALSPEGGRNTDGRLMPFKSGPFIFAINSKMPLIPTVIQGAYEVMKKGQWIPNSDVWSRTVRVSFLEPIPIVASLSERQKIQEIAFQKMNHYLEAHPFRS